MDFLQRLAHLGRHGKEPAPDPAPPADAGEAADPEPVNPEPPVAVPAPVPCPSCATLISPPPARSRRCPHCRQPIVVRRTAGRTVYLTEAAVAVFERERRRHVDEAAWDAARGAWLRLASRYGAPHDRVARVAERPITADAVTAARALGETAATKAIRAAARAKAWDTASRAGRDLAAERHHADGSPAPPDEETAAVHREAMLAQLRSLRATGKHAELVGGACCAACRADDGRVLAIDDELRAPRLPHVSCPRGLCACEWWLAGVQSAKSAKRRTRTRR